MRLYGIHRHPRAMQMLFTRMREKTYVGIPTVGAGDGDAVDAELDEAIPDEVSIFNAHLVR